MNQNLQLWQDQRLKLNLTPEIRQSIDILQAHSLDLAAYLQERSLDNPVLEIEYAAVPMALRHHRKLKYAAAAEYDPITYLTADEPTLEEILLSQLRMNNIQGLLYETAAFLAGNLDEAGYLKLDLQKAANDLKLPMCLMAEALETLQTMDPPGIAARDLRECLLIQVQRDGNKPFVEQIIHDYFTELSQGKYKIIAKKLGISEDQVLTCLHYIQKLNPKPGLQYAKKELQPVLPDAEIRKEKGRIAIYLLERHLPSVSLNPYYSSWSEDSKLADYESSTYLKQKIQEANMILKNLEKRKRTLLRVIQIIVDEQTPFLELGVSHLKPLNMKTVSTRLGLHESTVSRAVQNKYIQTPQGIFELKYFFSRGLASMDGQTASRNKVKLRIKQLINSEPKNKPLSDSQLVKLLEKEGIELSRRTVTKYREELHILPSILRKNK